MNLGFVGLGTMSDTPDVRTYAPAAALAAQAFNALFAHPDVRWDSAAVVKVVEEMSGFPARDSGIGTR